MFIERPPMFLRWFWPGVWRKKQDGKKVVYLTFDDGPCPETTPQLLDILERNHIKATFFCVGDNVRKFPHLFDELKQRGHHVGNHTMHHLKGFRTDCTTYIDDVAVADTYIHSTLLRPPYGRIKPAQLRALRRKYTIVFWDVITRDYNACLTPEQVLRIVKRYTRNGSIVVFHDSKKAAKNMLATIQPAIDFLKSEGYKFCLL
ncbi:MAG: polysaccharide deacetylase family protein [Paludibacteraceae bacterium]